MSANETYVFSVIVPVYNEQENINDCLSHIRSQYNDNTCQIIVVDGDENASTINAINNDKIVKIVSKKGRANQMNGGAGIADADILLFLHADTKLPKNAFEMIYNAITAGEYAAGAFDLGIDTKNIFIKFIAFAGKIRSRLTRIPYGDQGIFISKDFFYRIGGFKNIPLMEDVDLMRRIKRSGERICILKEKVSTSARRWHEDGLIYTTIRNLVLVTLYYLGVNPNRLAKFYKSGYSKNDLKPKK
jgi:rSAM/selenodomain-associated transferase 2